MYTFDFVTDVPPTNHTVHDTYRHTLEQLSQNCVLYSNCDYLWLSNVFALMMAVDYNVLPPDTGLTRWLVL